MENILKEINTKIKEIAQSEEIDTQKLTELINIRDRLKGFSTTSISQVQGFNNPVQPVPAYPIFNGIGNNRNSLSDSIMDVANIFLKNSSKQLESKSVNDLIHYHRFISELESSTDMQTTSKRCEIKEKLETLILDEFIIQINKRNDKDKIIETTSEVKQ